MTTPDSASGSPSKKNSIFLKVKFPPTKVYKQQNETISKQDEADSSYNNNSHDNTNSSSSYSSESSNSSAESTSHTNDNTVETITYPFEFKVVCLDKNCNVLQAIKCIQTTFKLPLIPTIGLYNPFDHKWLEDKMALKDIPELPAVEYIEYRNTKEPIDLGSTKERRRLSLGYVVFKM